MQLKPVHIDGALYVGIAVFASIMASLDTDQAAKIFANSPVAFWCMKTFVEAAGAGCASLKMVRSTAYASSLGVGPPPQAPPAPPAP